MENAKEEIYQMRYNTILGRLQIGKTAIIRKLCNTIKKHKVISMAVISLIIFSCANIIMIYQFMKILQNL